MHRAIRSAHEALGIDRDGSFPLICGRESHFHAALEEIFAPGANEVEDLEVDACLVPGTPNGGDAESVSVEVGGMTVAFLNRDDARTYRSLIARKDIREVLSCRGRIRDIMYGSKSEKSRYTLQLDLTLHESRGG